MTRSVIDETIRRLPRRFLSLVGENRVDVSLRSTPIEQDVTLPDGRVARLRIAMAGDEYIPRREEQTVVIELRIGRHVVAALDTVLDPEKEEEATALAQQVIAGLASGRIEPTAGALEPYADSLL